MNIFGVVERVFLEVTEDFKENIVEKCPDEVVGILEFKINKNQWRFKEEYILKEERIKNKTKVQVGLKKNNKRIVVVLESPHNDEYSSEIIGPALGDTGVNFKEYFIQLFNEFYIANPIIDICEYEIIFMNAIQYKTSLGFGTNVFRDRVWLTLWSDKKIRCDFKIRITQYQPDIIINLCTVGSHEKDPIIPQKGYINYEFIKLLNLGIIQLPNGDLNLYNELIFDNKYAENKTLKGKKYKLNYFVQTLINSINISTFNIEGSHPSSWRRRKTKFKITK